MNPEITDAKDGRFSITVDTDQLTPTQVRDKLLFTSFVQAVSTGESKREVRRIPKFTSKNPQDLPVDVKLEGYRVLDPTGESGEGQMSYTIGDHMGKKEKDPITGLTDSIKGGVVVKDPLEDKSRSIVQLLGDGAAFSGTVATKTSWVVEADTDTPATSSSPSGPGNISPAFAGDTEENDLGSTGKDLTSDANSLTGTASKRVSSWIFQAESNNFNAEETGAVFGVENGGSGQTSGLDTVNPTSTETSSNAEGTEPLNRDSGTFFHGGSNGMGFTTEQDEDDPSKIVRDPTALEVQTTGAGQPAGVPTGGSSWSTAFGSKMFGLADNIYDSDYGDDFDDY